MLRLRLLMLLALVPLAWFGQRAWLPSRPDVLGGALLVVLGGLMAIAWLRRRPSR